MITEMCGFLVALRRCWTPHAALMAASSSLSPLIQRCACFRPHTFQESNLPVPCTSGPAFHIPFSYFSRRIFGLAGQLPSGGGSMIRRQLCSRVQMWQHGSFRSACRQSFQHSTARVRIAHVQIHGVYGARRQA